ncbi:hypothetical protein PMAYCL1PPCAC_01695 [Pristionchus mayeri]|uniref:Lipocalin/cytosolic fatty-acid binding domain-containing protein n=1 Tax=Pristionchus mayeri TaxID=1317129 RepID=A0AAN4Z6Q8_9BILA|nr:hypothetical protein PMAYCL1PPCAC_01695 [Pristionchus mayeri]
MCSRKLKRAAALQNELTGEWNLLRSKNFDKFLSKLGFGSMHRYITALESTTLTISIRENIWTMFTEGSFAIHRTTFEIGKTIEERTIDGRTVKCTWSMGRIRRRLRCVERNEETGVKMTSEMYVKGGLLIHKMKCGGVTATRRYEKLSDSSFRRLSSSFLIPSSSNAQNEICYWIR